MYIHMRSDVYISRCVCMYAPYNIQDLTQYSCKVTIVLRLVGYLVKVQAEYKPTVTTSPVPLQPTVSYNVT